MNLFVFDQDPVASAAGLDDKRIGSALLEANQMMSTALIQSGVEGAEVGPGLLCRPSHEHHPVTLWVGQTSGNFAWTYAYAMALIDEWQLRYGTWHSSGDRTPYIWRFRTCIADGPLLPFQNSARHEGLGLDFTHLPVPESYQAYLQERWLTDKRPPTYTNREWPTWARWMQ